MKTTAVLTFAASALALGACATTPVESAAPAAREVATAQPEKTEKKEQYRSKGGSHSKTDFFYAYDANEDGKVSVEEYRTVRDEGFDARDPNGDAAVLPDEYVAEYEARLEQDLAARRDMQIKQAYVRFGVLDGDKDGVLTRAEFQAAGQNMFDRLDTNKDGVVDDADTKDAY